MCDVSDPRILNAYYGITEDEPVNWLLAGYKDSRNVIVLYSSGTNGLGELRKHVTNEILFGFIRVEDKFVLVTYVPDSVNGVRRARALVHSRSMAALFPLSHAQITASSLSELSDSTIRSRLKLDQIPNRPTKRTTINNTRRRSTLYVPESSSTLNIQTTLDETLDDTPTSPTFSDSTTVVDSIDDKEDSSETVFQYQLRRKREMDEARFKQDKLQSDFPRFNSRRTLSQQSIHEPSIHEPPKRAQSQPMMVIPETSFPIHPTQIPESIHPLASPTDLNPPETSQNLPSKRLSICEISSSDVGTDLDSSKNISIDGFVSVQTYPIPFWKRRYFIIKPTRLMFYKDELSNKAIVTIDIKNVKIEMMNEDHDAYVPNSFMINTPTDSFQILADDKKVGRKIVEILESKN